MAKDNYYDILGVSQTATHEEIKEAYRVLASVWHPDRFPQGSKQWTLANAKLKAINAAYEVLKDPQKRAEYDRKQEDDRSFSHPVTPLEKAQQLKEALEANGQRFWLESAKIVPAPEGGFPPGTFSPSAGCGGYGPGYYLVIAHLMFPRLTISNYNIAYTTIKGIISDLPLFQHQMRYPPSGYQGPDPFQHPYNRDAPRADADGLPLHWRKYPPDYIFIFDEARVFLLVTHTTVPSNPEGKAQRRLDKVLGRLVVLVVWVGVLRHLFFAAQPSPSPGASSSDTSFKLESSYGSGSSDTSAGSYRSGEYPPEGAAKVYQMGGERSKLPETQQITPPLAPPKKPFWEEGGGVAVTHRDKDTSCVEDVDRSEGGVAVTHRDKPQMPNVLPDIGRWQKPPSEKKAVPPKDPLIGRWQKPPSEKKAVPPKDPIEDTLSTLTQKYGLINRIYRDSAGEVSQVELATPNGPVTADIYRENGDIAVVIHNADGTDTMIGRRIGSP